MGSCTSTNTVDTGGSPSPSSVVPSEGRFICGRWETYVNARNTDSVASQFRPDVKNGWTRDGKSVWTDGRFDRTISSRGTALQWLRSEKLGSGDRLFGDRIDMYSVLQGGVDDCYFIAVLSAVARYPDLIREVIPMDTRKSGATSYDGLFHARFFHLGQWIDVHTDDFLPYKDDQRLFGGHSPDPEVLWVALLEKALVKFCGGRYSLAENGNKEFAFTLLTGGLIEPLYTVKKEESDKVVQPDVLFRRIERALSSGTIVVTSTAEELGMENKSGLSGLPLNHAFSVSNITKLKCGKLEVKLIKLRNSWGGISSSYPPEENGDWKGRWSRESKEWKDVPEGMERDLNVDIKEGGEFWICLEDYTKIFDTTLFCMVIPDFDEDGYRRSDELDRVVSILGEWTGETAAGETWSKKMKNPRFILKIPRTDTCDKCIPVLFVLMQETKSRISSSTETLQLIRLDVYRIVAEEQRGGKLCECLDDLTNPTNYVSGDTVHSKYRLTEGRYLLLPNFMKKPSNPVTSLQFCVRVFTPVKVECHKQLEQSLVALVGNPDTDMTSENQVGGKITKAVFGEFAKETSSDSCETIKMDGTRFRLDLQAKDSNVSVQFKFRNEFGEFPELPTRLDVYKVDCEGHRDGTRWLCLREMTNQKKYQVGRESTHEYGLYSGKYLLLPSYTGRKDFERTFCIRMSTSAPFTCSRTKTTDWIFVRASENSLSTDNILYQIGSSITCSVGEWTKEHKTKDSYPQFCLSVRSEATSEPTLIALMQEFVEPILPIGCMIFKVDEDSKLPLDHSYIGKNSKSSIKCVDGSTHPSCQEAESSGYYLLESGRYVIIAVCHVPTESKKFALMLLHSGKSNFTLQSCSSP